MGKVEMVGIPSFWQKAHDAHPEAFEALLNLMTLQRELLSKPLDEPLHIVLRHMAKVALNSVGALTTLLLNGYGHDGMKIARSIFEAAVTARYLAKYPKKVKDFIDFIHIRKKKNLDYADANVPEVGKDIPAGVRQEIIDAYKRVLPRFKVKKGVRSTWSDRSIAQMAAEVGMGDQYKTFYNWASSLHHVDVSGLASQTDVSGDVDVAPSMKWIDIALITGHQCVVLLLGTLNDTAALGMEAGVQQAMDNFKKAWEKQKAEPATV